MTLSPAAVTDADALARRLDVPRLVARASLPSTMDLAHELAASGTPAGTVVLADSQTAGRGRGGKGWTSPSGGGLWMSVVERPVDDGALETLSLRVGLGVAGALDRFAGSLVQLKWPNDLLLHGGKVGGILVEARWRGNRPDWVVIGVGINWRQPGVAGAATLGAETSRDELLAAVVPAVRGAAAARGPMDGDELTRFAERDWSVGRRVSAPLEGTVVGLSATGGVLIRTATGVVAARTGSLVFEETAS